jgi:hypothetical protein
MAKVSRLVARWENSTTRPRPRTARCGRPRCRPRARREIRFRWRCGLSWTRPSPPVHRHLVQLHLQPAGHGLAEPERGAAGGILLLAMMALDDFHVVAAVLQRAPGLLQQREQQVHAQAHVGRLHHGDYLGRLRDGGLAFRPDSPVVPMTQALPHPAMRGALPAVPWCPLKSMRTSQPGATAARSDVRSTRPVGRLACPGPGQSHRSTAPVSFRSRHGPVAFDAAHQGLPMRPPRRSMPTTAALLNRRLAVFLGCSRQQPQFPQHSSNISSVARPPGQAWQ